MLVVTSCEKDREKGNFEELLPPVSQVDSPWNGNVGQEICLIVKHSLKNGCREFSRSETVENGKNVTVTFFAWYPINRFALSMLQ